MINLNSEFKKYTHQSRVLLYFVDQQVGYAFWKSMKCHNWIFSNFIPLSYMYFSIGYKKRITVATISGYYYFISSSSSFPKCFFKTLHTYTLIMRKQKEKLRPFYFYFQHSALLYVQLNWKLEAVNMASNYYNQELCLLFE